MFLYQAKWTHIHKQKHPPLRGTLFVCGGDGLDCRRISAKRHSLRWRTEGKHSPYGARSREPTIIRRPSVNHLLQRTKKRPTKGVFVRLVEVVGVEPTSYSAAKKLSTYLVYLLFLTFSTRVNTLWKSQKAIYSLHNTFRLWKEGSV